MHEVSYEPNAKVTFDIDCDGIGDFNIRSSGAVDINSPWERLSFGMAEGVEVLNSGVGLVTTFITGDTIPTSDIYYTENLDFFYGTGEAGPYGRYVIEEKYIVYRKKSETDTSYIFIEFSHEGLEFTIHEIVSACKSNPLEVITPTHDVHQDLQISIYPNPTNDNIYLSEHVEKLEVYSMEGILFASLIEPDQRISIGYLKPGNYLVLWTNKGKTDSVIITKF
jgi:hypothetical protein